MKKNQHFLFVLGISLSCLLSFAPQVARAADAAKVNAASISQEELNKKYRESLKFFQFKAPTKKSVLDDLIKRELALQEARKMGLEKDPEIRDRMETVLYHALIEKKLGKEFEAIHITDDEAKTFYSENPEVRTSHIFVAVRPDAPAADVKKAKEKIEKAEAALKDGKMSFAEVAQRFSEGVAAPMGGDIDYQTKDKLDPTYYETAVKLKSPGKVSGIVRTQFGFHIIKLTSVREWEDVDKAQVKRLVFDQKRSQIFEKYIAQLRKNAKVTINNDTLRE